MPVRTKMNQRVTLMAVALLMGSGAVVSCSDGGRSAPENAASDNQSLPSPGTSGATGPAGGVDGESSGLESGEATLSELDALMPPSGSDPYAAGPIQTADLEGNRVYAHLQYLIGRIDRFLAENGVPGDWETDGFNHIAFVTDGSYWDPEVLVGFTGFADGGYELSGWSESDDRFSGPTATLTYKSDGGFSG